MKSAVALLLALLVAQLLAAQAPLAFDAASVKLNTSGGWRHEMGPAVHGDQYLRATRGPVEVVVIDQVEHPTED